MSLFHYNQNFSRFYSPVQDFQELRAPRPELLDLHAREQNRPTQQATKFTVRS